MPVLGALPIVCSGQIGHFFPAPVGQVLGESGLGPGEPGFVEANIHLASASVTGKLNALLVERKGKRCVNEQAAALLVSL